MTPWSVVDPEGTYNWDNVFGYARPRLILPDRPPEQTWDRDTSSLGPDIGQDFTRDDVKKILAYSDGLNEEDDWIMLGELNDGRFFFIYAGCDYTGWDCQAHGGSYVADSPEKLIQWAMADYDRERLGLTVRKDA